MAINPANPLDLGSTYRFEVETGIRKDGEVWDLTAATVYLNFQRPNGTGFARAVSILNASLGLVRYSGTTSDLDVAGIWGRAWRVVQGDVDVTQTPYVNFRVVASPSGA